MKKKYFIFTLLLCLIIAIPFVSNGYTKTTYYKYNFSKTMYTNSSMRLYPSRYCTTSNTTWTTSNSNYATVNKYGTVYTKGYYNKTVYITAIRRNNRYKNIRYKYTYKIYIKAKKNNYITKNITMLYCDEVGGSIHMIYPDYDVYNVTSFSSTNNNVCKVDDVFLAYRQDAGDNHGKGLVATGLGNCTIYTTGYTYDGVVKNVRYNVKVVHMSTPKEIEDLLVKKGYTHIHVWETGRYTDTNPVVPEYNFEIFWVNSVGTPHWRNGVINCNDLTMNFDFDNYEYGGCYPFGEHEGDYHWEYEG